MPRPRSTYTAEFKLQAAKMVTDQKLSVAEVARSLDVGKNLLREWRKTLLARGDAARCRDEQQQAFLARGDAAYFSNVWRAACPIVSRTRGRCLPRPRKPAASRGRVATTSAQHTTNESYQSFVIRKPAGRVTRLQSERSPSEVTCAYARRNF